MEQAQIDAIKGRLAAAPGLPWALDEVFNQIYSPGTGDYIGTEGDASDPEIAFILNAPADMAALLQETEQLRQQVAGLGELRGKVTSFLEDFVSGCEPMNLAMTTEAATHFWAGANTERARNLAWAELKAKELGIAWPIKPIPYGGGLPTLAPPAPACPSNCGDRPAPAAFAGCVQCGATDAQMAVPGYRCLQGDSLCNSLIDCAASEQPTPPEALGERQGHQVPGMPHALCHGCALPCHVARCRNANCPMK